MKIYFHWCRNQNQDFKLVSRSCRLCSNRVGFVTHSCLSRRAPVACVWHSYCKLDQSWSSPFFLTLFRMEWAKKAHLTSFSTVTSADLRSNPQNFLTFSLTLFPHLCKFSRQYLVQVTNYWTWTKTTPQKIGFSGQILVLLRLW